MAHLEDLIAEVQPAQLRAALAEEARQLKKRTKFGLVFERHMPETTLLSPAVGLAPGDEVALRNEANNGRRLVVESLKGKKATLRDDEGETEAANIAQLLVVKSFGEPVYPTLTPIGSVKDKGGDGPQHLVIEGENYHALEVLALTCSGQVDCIFIDPPYNTGNPDWKYNNRYVDDNDRWRHSKWLSMMERRLKLAKRLLKPDGVLIVTIDEHEVTHLGVMLEQKNLFAEATRQLVTIVNNPKGVTEERFSRVEEYAYFCFLGGAAVGGLGDDLLTPQTTDDLGEGSRPRWKGLLRSGDKARRQDRKNMFFPVLIDPDRGAVVGTGDPLPYETKPNFKKQIDGLVPVWPVRKDLSLGRWGVGHVTLRQLIDKGYVEVGGYDETRDTWAISYLSRRHREQIDAGLLQKVSYDQKRNLIDVTYTDPQMRRVKRVWHRSSHDGGAGGSDLLRTFLAGERRFTFPKSLYLMRDALGAVTMDNPDALILDFFGGSGTTLHATAYLNSQDAGRRRCIIVTNNEVSAEEAQELAEARRFPGDAQYERHGVFEAVARPRIEAALTGKLPDGSKVSGTYLDGRPFAEGFSESCHFLKLDYLNPDEVELGNEFGALHPLAWLTAGGYGDGPGKLDDKKPFAVLPDAGYAVLFDPVAFSDLLEAIGDELGIEHVFLLTDSEQAYTDMASALRPRKTTMLPRDYLRHFRRTARL